LKILPILSPKKLLNSTVLGLTLGVSLAAYAVFAFDPPTATPPGDNVDAPLNTGPVTQIKTGELRVGSFVVLGGTLLNGITQINGNVGIGMPASGNKLDVAGDVRWSGTLQGGLVPWENLTAKPSTATRWPSWGEVTSKPAVLTSESDPQVQTVNSGQWCRGDASGNVQCDQAPPAPGGGGGKQRFTSSGTFAVPAGVTQVWVTIVGGGGGGGGGRGAGLGAGWGGVGGSGTQSRFGSSTPIVANGGGGGLAINPLGGSAGGPGGGNGGKGGNSGPGFNNPGCGGEGGSNPYSGPLTPDPAGNRTAGGHFCKYDGSPAYGYGGGGGGGGGAGGGGVPGGNGGGGGGSGAVFIASSASVTHGSNTAVTVGTGGVGGARGSGQNLGGLGSNGALNLLNVEREKFFI